MNTVNPTVNIILLFYNTSKHTEEFLSYFSDIVCYL